MAEAGLVTNVVFQSVGVASLTTLAIRAGLPGSSGMVYVFLALAAVTLGLLAAQLRAMEGS
jgi:hypothetical protein